MPGSRSLSFTALMLVTVTGCGGREEPYRKETYPVVGTVTVDGEVPKPPVKVHCVNVQGMDKEHPTISSALTGDDGRFEIATYEQGDGVPEGDYVLTFEWGDMNMISMRYGGPDKLKGRYSNPETSEHRFSVKAGEHAGPIDLGTIALTTE